MEKSPKRKILQLIGYSSGPSGVWQRCKEESKQFLKMGYEVLVLSSNGIKGKPKERAPAEEIVEGIKVKRFPYWKLGGESYMTWPCIQEGTAYEPDIIITHSYRHTHSSKALKIRDNLIKQGKKCKCICVTHAPFVKGRSLIPRIVVYFKDLFSNLNKFDKVVAVCKWEIPMLRKLIGDGWRQKIRWIPNSIESRYFQDPINHKGKGVYYLGRYHPIKDLKTLLNGIASSEYYDKVTLIGSGDPYYVEDLILWAEKAGNSKVGKPIYDIEKKIKAMDKHEIFVLSLLREAFPIALFEAMSRGKIVVASRTDGAKEIIKNERNGFLFDIGYNLELAKILDNIYKMPKIEKMKIRNAARKTAEKYKMSVIMNRWERILA
jgi:glycosyltransferase involved in cell wall biosynthesis